MTLSIYAQNSEFNWLGRYDNVVNSGGVKLFPEHIEAKLAPVVQSRFFVTGVPDEKLGQKLIMVLEEKDMGDDGKDEKAIRDMKSLDNLNKYEVPQEIYRVAKFQETDSGKIQRKVTLAKLMS